MPGRRCWLLIVLIETLIFCTVGYNLNGGRPSILLGARGPGLRRAHGARDHQSSEEPEEVEKARCGTRQI